MSEAPRLPVYVFPVRIQQGWGDIQEMANACWAIARHASGCELLALRPLPEGLRRDPRAQFVDPTAEGPVRFPPIRAITRPTGRGRAVVLASWWGTTARRKDAEGSPLPGTLEPLVEAVRQGHGPDSTLIVSLEEFASEQSSHEALDEGMRQAGWDVPRRSAQLRSTTGKKELELYRRAYTLARGGERQDVLHLVSTICPGAEGVREFPFLVPVGPFYRRSTRNRPGVSASGARKKVVWYASPASSPAFASTLFPSLERLGPPVDLLVRASPEVRGPLPTPWGPQLRVTLAPQLSMTTWRARWRDADLRIASGSQTLLEAVSDGRPFLYFNGIVQGPGERPRGFRREKLLSLTRGLRTAGTEEQVVRDLELFADGEDLPAILQRALSSSAWRTALVRGLAQLPVGLSPSRRDGGKFLAQVLAAFSRSEGELSEFVRAVRAGEVPSGPR